MKNAFVLEGGAPSPPGLHGFFNGLLQFAGFDIFQEQVLRSTSF